MRSENGKTVILVNPYFPFLKGSNSQVIGRRNVRRQYPPVNLLQLGGHLRANGYKVKILDCFVERNPLSFIDRICAEEEVVLVGITVKMAYVVTVAMQIAYYVKANYSNVKVVWGGLLPTVLPENVLRESYADYVISGKGEETLLLLADAIVEGRGVEQIPGLSFLDDNASNDYVYINQNDRVGEYNADWSLIEDKLHPTQQPYYAGMVTTMGCPLRCSFCYLTSMDAKGGDLFRWYERPLEQVMRDVDTLLSHGMNVFTFQDDNFLMNKKRILPIVVELKKRKVYIEQCVTSVGTITEEIVKEIHPIIQTISYSIETVNPRLQKILNKNIEVDAVLRVNKMFIEHDINSVHNFIFGIPSETDDDLRMNVDLAVELRKINPYIRLQGILCVPFPQSSLEDWIRENMDLSIPWDLRMLATIDMTNMIVSPAFQPWISRPDEIQFYNEFLTLFDAIFTRWSHIDNEKIGYLLKKKRLKKIFESAITLDKPPRLSRPYILDNLLSNPDTPYPMAKFSLKNNSFTHNPVRPCK